MRKLLVLFIILTYITLAATVYTLFRSNQKAAALIVSTPVAQPPPQKRLPSLPIDAVKISECIPDMGEHWVRPQDIPGGPYYVINQGKITAIEYMFKPDDIPGKQASQFTFPDFEKYMKDNNYNLQDFIRMNEIIYDLQQYEYHSIHMAWTAPHAGFPVPHMDMHAYLIPETEIKEICPNVSLEQIHSPEVIKTIQEYNIPMPEAPKPEEPQPVN